MPTALPTNMSAEQEEMFLRKDLKPLGQCKGTNERLSHMPANVYSRIHFMCYNRISIVHTRLEEIARKLKSGDVLPLDRER